MKTTLNAINKRRIVIGLFSCLTTFQLTLANAQEAPTTQRLSKEEKEMLYGKPKKLATPSFMIAPLRGFMIDGTYIRSESEIQIKNVEGVSKSSTDNFRTSIAYGLNNSFFFGAAIGYRSGNSTSDMAIAGQGSVQKTQSEGETDPDFIIGSRMNFENISITGTLNYLAGIGKSERRIKSDQVTEENNRNGGDEITPQVSVFTNSISKPILGGSLSYSIRNERKVSSKDQSGFLSELKTKGGNQMTVSAFIETPPSTLGAGAILSYMKTESSRFVSNLSETESQGSEFLAGQGYAKIRMGQNYSILPSITYVYFMNNRASSIELKSQTIYNGGLSLRAEF